MAYQQIQFIGWQISTLPVTSSSLPQQEEISLRCELLVRALQTALSQLETTSPPATPGTTLYVFLAPDAYFSGGANAYPASIVQALIKQLQSIAMNNGLTDWLLVPGSIVAVAPPGQSVDGKTNFILAQSSPPAQASNFNVSTLLNNLSSRIESMAMIDNSAGALAGELTNLLAPLPTYNAQGGFSAAGISFAMGATPVAPQLAGQTLVQVQLAQSSPGDVVLVAQQGGYLFLSDTSGDSQLLQITGSVASSSTVSPANIIDVPNSPLETTQSPPQSIPVNQLYQQGAGSLALYPPVAIPAPAIVPGSTVVPVGSMSVGDSGSTAGQPWIVNGYQFNFSLVYDETFTFSTALCQIISTAFNFQQNNYLIPLKLLTSTTAGATVSIEMSIRAGSSPYQYALWGRINVPGFMFEGVILQFAASNSAGNPAPLTCW